VSGRAVRNPATVSGIEKSGDGHTAHRAFEYDRNAKVTAILVGPPGGERLRINLTHDLTGALTKTEQIALDGSAATAVTCRDVAPGDRLMGTVSAEGIRVAYTRDCEGHVTQVLAGDVGPSPRSWDDGCLDHPTGGTGQYILGTFTYDTSGRLASATDERGQLTTITGDGFGRPVMVTRPDGTQARRGYDALGNVTWDALYTTANLPPYRFPSLADGGLHAATEMDYDLRDRLKEVRRWHFSGAQVPVGDGIARTQIVFDDVARTMTRIDDAGNSWVSKEDAAGRMIEERAPDGTTRSYSYPDARTVRIGDPSPAGTITRELALTAWGDVASEGPRVGTTTYPVTTTQFDEELRPVTTTSLTGGTVGLTYDAFGRPTRQVETVPGGTARQ
jgi:YD repeat-containing protein